MITARATGEDGREIIVLGITKGNIERLQQGQPIDVRAESHPGFPEKLVICIFYGEDERALTEQLKPLLGEETKVIGVPRGYRQQKEQA
jgi:hypothetical protein